MCPLGSYSAEIGQFNKQLAGTSTYIQQAVLCMPAGRGHNVPLGACPRRRSLGESFHGLLPRMRVDTPWYKLFLV